MLRGGTEFFLVPCRSKALVWHGHKKLLPSAVRLTAQPRWGHSDDSAITGRSVAVGLADQPDRSDRLAGVFDPGVAPLFDDGERSRNSDFELFEPRERLERFFPPLLPQRRDDVGHARHGQDQPDQRAQADRGESMEITARHCRAFLERGGSKAEAVSHVNARRRVEFSGGGARRNAMRDRISSRL